ncbi:MAG: VWA domain-containing protein [Pirellulales bacterium]
MFAWHIPLLGFEVTFDRPLYLLAFFLLPLLWMASFRSLAGLGRVRRLVALGLRTTVLAIFVLALAEIQLRWTSERLAVIYVLDQSLSIPEPQRRAMREYVSKEVRTHRKREHDDLAGVIVFGRDASIEVAPFDDDIQPAAQFESLFQVPRDATNLAGALKLANASFPENVARRIVIVTDGNENLGDARSVAKDLAEQHGVGIDVVPVELVARAEVAVEKVTLPPDIRQSQPFEARVVVNNFAEAGGEAAPVRGRLQVLRRSGRTEEAVSEQPVELKPGKNVYSFQQKLDDPAVYTYRAVFTPEDAAGDGLTQNNEATAFTHIRGKGRVLLIEDADKPGQFEGLVQRLRTMNLEVDVQANNNLFTNLAELQAYDTVVLANVPRVSGERGDEIFSFSDEQIRMLVRNTEQLGCGLVMLGGENSFGVGGWANTEVEKALPVDCQIKNAKIQAVGALVIIFHASELADGNGMQKLIARKSLEVLGPTDYAGAVAFGNFNSGDTWMWGAGQGGLIRVGANKSRMLAAIDRMVPGDMPDFDPAMRLALSGFNRVKASAKHMIIISDGDPAPPSGAIKSAFRKAGVTVSTVGVGTHDAPNRRLLEAVANETGGKFYDVKDPRALPAIFIREARKAARPLIKNLDGVPPVVTYRHEMLQGVDGPLPPINGFVMTTVKDSPLVEVAIRSPDPDDPENSTILASWTYGLGRTVAFTTDAGHKWAGAWESWSHYDKLFSQMVRWSMRPLGDTGKFTVATDHRDGRVKVTITALDNNDEFLNFLSISGAALNPKLDPIDIKIEQVGPGRYVTEFPATSAGSYFVTLNPGPGYAPLLAGVNVPYSPEYRDRESNEALIDSLVALKPKDGGEGKLIEGALRPGGKFDDMLQVDTFRHDLAKAVSSQNVWPWVMMIGMLLFFADVFVRRVHVTFEWLQPATAFIKKRLLRRAEPEADDSRLERLRSRKAAVTGQLDERRAAVRFEPETPTAGASTAGAPPLVDDVTAGAGGASPAAPPPTSSGLTPTKEDAESYTSRLLKAKQQARRDAPKSPDELN